MAKFDIIAATGCPTGIAHTFMAKEALEKAAAERGLTIKVETHGQVGVENELTKSEIAGAKAVVVAADKDVQAERFAGKRMVSVGVSKALSVEAAGKLIDRALAAKGDDSVAAAADVEDEVEEKESIGHIIYKHLMNGVSHMLVFVVAGGVLTAVSFLWGITSFDSTASDYNSFAAMLKIIGGIAMNLMVPVLSAYIAESIGKRPALVPGFVAGMIAIQGLPVNAETGMIDAGGAGVGFGFLGGIVGGFLAGYVILLLEKVFSKLPKNLDGLKAIFLYPLFSTAIVGLVMLGISGPMAATEAMTSGASPFRGGSTVTTSGRRPSLSSLAAMSAASPQKNSAFSMWLRRAFSLASRMAGGTISAPMTRFAAFARHSVMVPMPQ